MGNLDETDTGLHEAAGELARGGMAVAKIDRAGKTVSLTESGMAKAEQLLAHRLQEGGLYDPANIRLMHHLNAALRAVHRTTAVLGTVFGSRTEVVHRLRKGDALILVPDPPGTDVPAVWVHTGLHPDYHTANDDARRYLHRGLAERNFERRFHIVNLEELNRFNQGMATLDTVITAAPLLGLLGTVVGMVKTFALITVFVALTLNFVLFRAAPGDATSSLRGCRNCTPEFRESLYAELGLARAYVSGSIGVQGDIYEVLGALPLENVDQMRRKAFIPRQRAELAALALKTGALGRAPDPPALVPRLGGGGWGFGFYRFFGEGHN